MQRLGIALFTPTISDMMEIARLADEAGFDSLWNGEFFNRNGLVTLAAVATCTQRAKIATGIAYAYMRNPVLNATGAMDIDELSNGRLILGLGSGTRSMNEMWYGEKFEPAVQKGMLRTTGEVADGLVGHPLYSRKYIAEFIRPNIEVGARRAGRDPKDIDITTLLITAISHDRGQAIRDAKNQIAFYASVKSYEGILNMHGWEEQKLAIWKNFKTFNLPKMAAAVTDDMVEQIAIAGTPEECREQIGRKWPP